MTTIPHYLSWSISEERQRHEWLRLRRSIMGVRLGFVVGAHVTYFALCALAHRLGCFQQYGHSFWVGFWSMGLIGILLFALEHLYTRTWRIERPRFAIRKNGVTLYGDDGPSAHYDWSHKPVLHIESDRHRPDYRSLVLCEAHKYRWMRRAGRVSIPLPSLDDIHNHEHERIDEGHVVEALRKATEDHGLQWITSASGEIVLLAA